MDEPTRPPAISQFTAIKITLIVALAATLSAFVFFGLSVKQKERKETFHLLGGGCLVVAAILLFAAAVQYVFTGNKGSTEHLERSETLPPAPSSAGKKRATLFIISADSWCGFSKKMSAEVPLLQSLVGPVGVDVVLVSDQKDKAKFDQLSAEHSARGFPHSVLMVGGSKVADIPGYMEASKMKDIVSSKLF